MKVRRKIRKGSLITIILAVLVVMAVAVGYVITTKTMRAAHDIQVSALQDRLDTNTHMVYVATEDIQAGKVIEEAMLYEEQQLVTQADALFTADDIGRTALVNIPAGTVLTKVLVTNPSDESTSRLVEYTCLHLSALMEEGSYVDVRIRFQNGEDMAVITKKRVEKLSLAASSCYFTVSETEQQRMASAINDAKVYDAVLYTTIYTKPSIQEASLLTYPPRAESIALITAFNGEDTDELLRLRGALELRIGSSDKEYADVEREPIDISNFSSPKVDEQANNNDTGMVGAPIEEAVASETTE